MEREEKRERVRERGVFFFFFFFILISISCLFSLILSIHFVFRCKRDRRKRGGISH